MTNNKRVSNEKILSEIKNLRTVFAKYGVDIVVDPMTETELNALAVKVVSRMVKLKSMEDWFDHVNRSELAWSVAYEDLELTEEENALGEAAKLMTLMNLFQDEEEYEKCAIIKGRIAQVNKVLKKGKK
tara:strand:+ start:40 stop:426 length:387 start_codon:yes stop_codon:yes gene_type:complete